MTLKQDTAGGLDQANDEQELREGFVRDYISGQWTRAAPEELDAVRVLAVRLVEDYGYSKEQLQTHPQFRVRKRPSDDERSYPIDLAIFRSSNKTEDQLFCIAECKRANRKDGVSQLARESRRPLKAYLLWLIWQSQGFSRRRSLPERAPAGC